MSFALKLALAPLLIAQAIATRRRALVLPEAEGARAGRVGAAPGPALRVLVAGDSSAAGVGVARQRHAVVGHLTRHLHQRLGIPVEWTLRARSGLTTRQLHAMLAADPPPGADVAVVITGVNDVIDQVSWRRAVRHRAALAAWLLDRCGARHVVFAPLPAIGRFPLLPQPLRRCLGADAARHDAALARWSAGRADVSHACIEIELTADTMAPDGFHPGEPVYRVCGEALARHIADSVWPALQRDDGRPIVDAGERRAQSAAEAASAPIDLDRPTRNPA
jgi:lysophospholipase L1-like esterase